jgi:hypothetical protein
MRQHTKLAIMWPLLLGLLVAWSGAAPGSMATLTQLSVHGGRDLPYCNYRDCTYLTGEPCVDRDPLCTGSVRGTVCGTEYPLNEYKYEDTSSRPCTGESEACDDIYEDTWTSDCVFD